jgi:polar amino acid transport system substrate-binding protein
MYLISRRFLYFPITLRGKFIALLGTGLIGFLMVTIIASISSSVTIALTYEHDQFSDPGKLADRPIAAVEGTTHLEMSKQLGAIPIPATDLAQAFSLLKRREVEGVIGDHETLRYYIKKNKITSAQLADLTLSYDELTFMLPLDSPWRKMIDQQILYLQDSGYTKMICERYIGLNAKYCTL